MLYRKIAPFRKEGMESLFSSPKAKRRVLPPAIRRKIVDLKAEHPPLNLEEIATLFGRRPDGEGRARGERDPPQACQDGPGIRGRTLSRYDVSLSLGAKLESVTNPRLFASPYETGQPKLFALGEGGWIKAMRLKGYAPRSPGRPKALQQALFRYAGGAPVAQSSGVATLSLLPSGSLISISLAHEASSTSAPNSPAATTTTKAPRLTTTPAHHETGIAPAFEEQLRELL